VKFSMLQAGWVDIIFNGHGHQDIAQAYMCKVQHFRTQVQFPPPPKK